MSSTCTTVLEARTGRVEEEGKRGSSRCFLITLERRAVLQPRRRQAIYGRARRRKQRVSCRRHIMQSSHTSHTHHSVHTHDIHSCSQSMATMLAVPRPGRRGMLRWAPRSCASRRIPPVRGSGRAREDRVLRRAHGARKGHRAHLPRSTGVPNAECARPAAQSARRVRAPQHLLPGDVVCRRAHAAAPAGARHLLGDRGAHRNLLARRYFNDKLQGAYMDQHIAFAVFLPHLLPKLPPISPR